MKKVMTITAILTLSAVCAAGQVKDTLSINARTFQWSDPFTSSGTMKARELSDAVMLLAPYSSYSRAEGRFDLRKEDNAMVIQEGDGLIQGSFNAESFLTLDRNSAVSGNVSYERGQKKNVVWNETSDFDLLSPYVLLDSLGGNLQKEQYSFSGAYSKKGENLIWMLKGGYRALHEYRTIDPRPRNITSDMNVRGSVGHTFRKYTLMAAAGYRRYQQSQGVEFVSPVGANTNLFHGTGLGNDFVRFESTGTYSNTRYKGYGLDGGILLRSASGNIDAGMNGSFFSVTRHLTSQNEAPITVLYTRKVNAFASWKIFTEKKFNAALIGDVTYRRKDGDENVIDNTHTGDYERLMALRMYANNDLDAVLKAVIRKSDDERRLTLEPFTRFAYESEKYMYPQSSTFVASITGGMEAGFARKKNTWIIDGKISGEWTGCLSSSFEVASVAGREKFHDAWESMYRKMMDNRIGVGLNLMVHKEINGSTGIYSRIRLKEIHFGSGDWTTLAAVSAGIAF